ncbi:MAG: hypothetical protein F082_2015, partial [bacterium F082]
GVNQRRVAGQCGVLPDVQMWECEFDVALNVGNKGEDSTFPRRSFVMDYMCILCGHQCFVAVTKSDMVVFLMF